MFLRRKPAQHRLVVLRSLLLLMEWVHSDLRRFNCYRKRRRRNGILCLQEAEQYQR
jgi:hypothetical protein